MRLVDLPLTSILGALLKVALHRKPDHDALPAIIAIERSFAVIARPYEVSGNWIGGNRAVDHHEAHHCSSLTQRLSAAM